MRDLGFIEKVGITYDVLRMHTELNANPSLTCHAGRPHTRTKQNKTKLHVGKPLTRVNLVLVNATPEYHQVINGLNGETRRQYHDNNNKQDLEQQAGQVTHQLGYPPTLRVKP